LLPLLLKKNAFRREQQPVDLFLYPRTSELLLLLRNRAPDSNTLKMPRTIPCVTLSLFAATGMVCARLVMRNFLVRKHTRRKRFLDPDQRFLLREISPNGETFSVPLSFLVAKFREKNYLFLINLQSLS
jgi:hypothetical protein